MDATSSTRWLVVDEYTGEVLRAWPRWQSAERSHGHRRDTIVLREDTYRYADGSVRVVLR